APTWVDGCVAVWAMAVTPKGGLVRQREEEARRAMQARDFDALNAFEEFGAPEGETPAQREARYGRIRDAVVHRMFDSSWSFDTLVEQKLAEVQMPATIFVRNLQTKRIEKYEGPMPDGTEPVPDITVLVRTPWPAALLEYLPPTEPALESISYVVRTHPQRGKFRPDRAVALGVEKGYKWAQLTQGKSVENIRGETITPDMVLGEGRPGQGVAVVDLPSLEYVEPLINREEWTSKDIVSGIRAFIWILGPGVSAHPMLREFMKKMADAKHIISSPDHCPNQLALDSVAASTIQLAQIDPERYPVPYHDNVTVPQVTFDRLDAPKIALPENAIVAERGLTIDLEPRFGIVRESITPLLDTQAVLANTPRDVHILAQAAHADIEASSESLSAWRRSIPRPDTEIITLGTGSALPSKYRNVSATLVRVPGVGSYLLDCGENTLGQLQRVYRPAELADVLRDLRMIWISHLHADHHLGTASVIKAWYQIVHNSVPSPNPPDLRPTTSTIDPTSRHLAIVSHTGMLHWLREFASVEDYGYSRLLPLSISNHTRKRASTLTLFPPPAAATTDPGHYVLHPQHYAALLGLSDLQAVGVHHCHGAKAVVLTFPPTPLRIAYSGDCRPSKDFARIGRATTVLVHEATFDDELKGDAVAKKHSTTTEALGVGAMMGARAVVLTHFSQRYQKIPVLETLEGEE
ncbi:hypothetical protein AOQ84DRAFT_278082, partial [Glonium stellatum]